MEDEEVINLVLEKLYKQRYLGGLQGVLKSLNDNEIFIRNNQLNRVMAEIKSNDFAIISKSEDDYQAEISPEGIVYCEDVLMIK